MKILFVYNEPATFVRIDLAILRSAHTVLALHVQRKHAGQLLASAASLAQQVRWADLVFAWFGGYHALLPFALGRALGRKCVVVASGYDVAAVPEIDYGNMRPGLRRRIGRQVFALADRVLAVSEFTRGEAIRNAGVPAGKIQVIPHGVDSQRFWPGEDVARAAQVLTVAGATKATMYTKGLPAFVALAARLPNTPFLVVGPCEDAAVAALRRADAPNVQFAGPLYGDDLVRVMQQSAVYAQLSAYESFGMALAEAMLCGCTPVVTQRGAMPEVIGDVGYTVPYGQLDAYHAAVEQALAAAPEAGVRARQRIVERYSLEQRTAQLLNAVEEVNACNSR